ncbi:MAG: SDR family NAD(P)-dependent oxidoreductase, partial [Planctomycetota bacterium]|nr:SDR family NAD(P)-dependent oxidoreductase [Planctomycetota bacterium]
MTKSARSTRSRSPARKALAPLDVEPRAASLEGRTAIVTGSSKGLGKAMAIALGEAGARVVVNYCNGRDRAVETCAELRDRGIQAVVCKADVTNERQVKKLVAATESKLGKPDIVVLNATPDQPQLPIEKYDWAFYQSMLDFFVKSPYLMARAVLPGMKRRKWGRIINIGSEVFRRGVPNFSAYVAAKGAQAGWTRSMASELAPWNITVNMVSPGWIPVERHDKDPQALKDGYKALIP